MMRKYLIFLLTFIVAVLTCMLALWLIFPRLLPAASPDETHPTARSVVAPSTGASASGVNSLPPITASGTPGASGNGLPNQSANLAPPISKEQQEIEDYERQRVPLYAFLRDKCRALVVDSKPALDDRATLSLYCTRSDNRIVTDILTQIVNPYVYGYGFRHVRFYLPNPGDKVEPWHLAAEADAKGPNNWQAFEK